MLVHTKLLKNDEIKFCTSDLDLMKVSTSASPSVKAVSCKILDQGCLSWMDEEEQQWIYHCYPHQTHPPPLDAWDERERLKEKGASNGGNGV